MNRKLITTILTCFLVQASFSQQLTQSIRGRITDIDSKVPTIGASVIVIGSDPFIGATTDLDGYFKLKDVPLGRVAIEITYIGYEKRIIPNILVTSGKEVFLTVELAESVNELETFEVVGNDEKGQPLNEMALISSRQFSTDETKRYAGTLNDPARMAGNFAGVSSNAEGNNDIIVRGNSPRGVLWRLEGIEIPNPNHFADEGATGGPINALNSKMLSNSEFLTGAFAPEYGNALSGVFDIQLREGNNEKREYSLGVGVLGTDISLEGPLKKGGRASYLANYRYSSLGILDDMGVVDFDGVPKYQDASFNVYLPTKKAGIFKLFGLAGTSQILVTESFSDESDSIVNKGDHSAHLLFTGLSHSYIFNEHTYLTSSLSFSNNGSGHKMDQRISQDAYQLDGSAQLEKYNVKLATTLNKKINAKNKLTAGVIYTDLRYTFDFVDRNPNNELETIYDVAERTSYLQFHTSWKYRINEDATLVTGVHYLRFNLNNTHSVEPRIGFSYKVTPNQTFTAGFGMHSKIESLLDYTTNVTDINGNTTQPNYNLELPKSNHYVVGYDYQFSENTHVKAEVYYQNLYDAPVENLTTSYYSTINQSEWSANKELISAGEGRNYGVELTLERYFHKNFFYLLTGSIYDTEYKTLANTWIKSRYNGKYTANVLMGKEVRVGKASKNKALITSVKVGLQGGNRYNPIDLNASLAAGETVYIDKVYSQKGDDVFYINLALAYRVSRKKTTHEVKLEFLNLTNNQAKVSEYYNNSTRKIEVSNQLPMFPNIMYTLSF